MEQKKNHQKQIQEFANHFPPTFRLKGFPGKVFRISQVSSRVVDNVVILQTEYLHEGWWMRSTYGTLEELKPQVIVLMRYVEISEAANEKAD